MNLFTHTTDQVFAELERVDAMLRVFVTRFRAFHGGADSHRGLYISDEDFDALLAQPAGYPLWLWLGEPGGHPYDRLEDRRRVLIEQAAASEARGVDLRLSRLCRALSLTSQERDVVLVCLAPHIDARYERIFAYLRDDVTKQRPSVDLVLNLLARDVRHKVLLRGLFERGATLVRERVLHLEHAPGGSLLSAELFVDPRLVSFALGADELDGDLAAMVCESQARVPLSELRLSPTTRRALDEVVARSTQSRTVLFCGPSGTGKRSAASAIAGLWNRTLLIARGELLCHDSIADFVHATTLVLREAALRGAVLYWDGFERLADPKKSEQLRALWPLLDAAGAPVILGSSALVEPEGDLRRLSLERVFFQSLSMEAKLELFRRELSGAVSDRELRHVVGQFTLNATQIADVAAAAQRRAVEEGEVEVRVDHVQWACRRRAQRVIASMVSRLEPRYGWSDIVLPKDALEQLQELCHRAKHQSKVLDEWGFGLKLSRGKGLAALFAGPSGTGKTMAAEVIAHELGCDLYKVDLASVVSKYIGETEKNLAKVFDEAEQSSAILFFDEADSLFGKRSEIKDAHDRYANLEVSYLLQRMEEFAGIGILATNSRKSLDQAFSRRIAFCINFSLPDAELRCKIWQKIWPSSVPLNADIDFESLGHRFELSAGNIKNVALASAFAAAANGQCVTIEHIVRAIHREYQKLGRICVQTEFGPYFSMMQV